MELHSKAGMGEISKQRQLNKKIRYGAVRDLSFYKIRCFLKILFKHHLLNEIKIFKIWIKRA
jgi:hypothetical protein